MPTKPCAEPAGSQIIAQTLFLGASVGSFNTSMGWGGQPSQLTVTLIEDSASDRCLIRSQSSNSQNNNTDADIAAQFPVGPGEDGTLKKAIDIDRFPLDHYHTCSGDGCYVNSKGDAFDSKTMDVSERMVPGKVYYEFFSQNNSVSANTQDVVYLNKCIKSKYWYNPDPGFFGQPNRINIDNTYIDRWNIVNANLNKGYDIIDTPVFFKMGNFTFGGLVQSWDRQIGEGGKTYTVVINSVQSLLNSCYVIVDRYAGAIYSKLKGSVPSTTTLTNNSLYGGPRNYTGFAGVDYFGKIYEGNLPNVFNVYGFLESFGKDGFGGANINTEGLSANAIVDSLSVLTGAIDIGTSPNGSANARLLPYHNTAASFNSYGPRSAFSPFGRILSKCMQENDTYLPISPAFKRFGVIPPTPVVQDLSPTPITNRCQFILDLSEIPRLPNDFRITGPVLTITDLLNKIAEHAGFDYYADLVPLSFNNKFYNVIKIKTISRLAQPRTNLIENTIKSLQCNGYAISNITVGKEKNESSARAVLIGGPVQRLYQAKSLRLAYTQSNYIFNPITDEFIDYMQLGTIDKNFANRRPADTVNKQFHYGKTRVPSALDLHNPNLSSLINPTYKGIYTHNDEIKQKTGSFLFNEKDTAWNDKDQLGTGLREKESGNYFKANIVKQETGDLSTWGVTNPQQRWFPLWKDVICPFFGFVKDNQLEVKLDAKNNDFRRVRPVWFDSWTGQIVVMVQVNELPETSVYLNGMFDTTRVVSDVLGNNRTIKTSYFLLTESEIRAALAGFDEFVVYCLSKTYSNDLIEMLRRAYILKDAAKYFDEGLDENNALKKAREKHNWFWRLMNNNINMPMGNIAGAFRQPIVPPAPVQAQGTYRIPQDVLKDLQILHNFVTDIAKNYGQKYMVVAPYLATYKETTYSKIALPTSAGTAFVFSGGGELKYSYNPTQDGAWEEYGNIIDDCIAVGSKDWYNLTDDLGKTVPILGYNANDSIDLVKYAACQMTQAKFDSFSKTGSLSPFWSFNAWDTMKDHRDATCLEGKYSFPSLDYSKLNSSDYVLVSVSGLTGDLPAIVDNRSNAGWQPSQFTAPTYSWTASISRDAFGKQIFGVPPISGLPSSRGQPTNIASPIKKLFVKATSVDENFVFLDPENLQEIRMLIDSPGINLNPVTQETASDPSSTILANAIIEDVAIYIRSTIPASRDNNWIKYMISHVYSIIGNSVNSYITGSLASSANKSAAYARMAPKAAHPFFAGVPLKSNVHNYGPWTNYPYLEYLDNPEGVFPSGISIKTSDSIPPACSGEVVIVNGDAAKRAVDNWILQTTVIPEESYVPWNYGGMAYLDNVAHNYVRSITNYQNVIEKAQIDIPGLPLFNLGGSFSSGNFSFIPSGVKCTGIVFQDVKYNLSTPALSLPVDLPVLYSPLINSTAIDVIEYQTLRVLSEVNYGSPVITNIQTSISQGGITSTYSFRTYTKKLGLFNKEYSDNLKRSNLDRIRRNKQLADAVRQTNNNIAKQQNSLSLNRSANNGEVNVRSKLFGWSPVKVLIGQSAPYLEMPYFDSAHTGIAMNSYIRQRLAEAGPQHKICYGTDPGHDSATLNNNDASLDYRSRIYLKDSSVVAKLSENMRHRTDVALFEEKEAIAQIQQDYGLQGMMSLDGIFSPVSFYPTFKNSTYHFTLYDTKNCPFCNGTKRISITYQAPLASSYGEVQTIDLYCDKCKNMEEKLNLSLKSNTTNKSSSQSLEALPPYIVTSGTDLSTLLEYGINKTQSAPSTSSSSSNSGGSAGQNIPINMVSLQPIVVPYGEFRNINVQSYKGNHPEGIHADLSIGAYDNSAPRTFFDRCRHSIEIVGRGAMVPADLYTGTSLTNASGYKYFDNNSQVPANRLIVNTDYYEKDVNLQKSLTERGEDAAILRENNQRFLGLRGPLVLHAWGYDLEGYPVPNAADEPYEFDVHGRPKRFLMKMKDGFPKTVKFKDLEIGDTYKYNNIEFLKEKNLLDTETLNLGTNDNQINITNSTDVSHTSYEDDLSNEGGFDPGASQTVGDRLTGYRGSIISKTQKWIPSSPGSPTGKWTEKKKLKEFYLNWAERPDIWPVGPIDLRWDPDRKVWATKADPGSIYKMVYVTLEEDLVKEDDFDETYPARAFLDDIEYSNQPLPDGFRRLVFVKDRGGYTAPRGAKLLCRYSSDSGFYEPISKQSFVVGGLVSGSSTATIQLSYIAGRKKGEPVPTMLVNFDNPFEFNTVIGNRGLFTFMNGKWTITATKEV